MRRTAVLGFVVLLVVLLISTGDLPRFARPEPPAQRSSCPTAGSWPRPGRHRRRLGHLPRGVPRAQVARRPPHAATVLQTLQDDGTYPNLYYGKNLLDEVPQDLYQQDWWYRTTFTPLRATRTYQLDFPGINYRAEIWLNGHLVADDNQIVGMYVDHELDVTPWIEPGQANTLAVKVTPERALQDVNGVELADSWFDWINWNYLGYQGPNKNPANGNSFVADRNAGIWKPVYLRDVRRGVDRLADGEHRTAAARTPIPRA